MGVSMIEQIKKTKEAYENLMFEIDLVPLVLKTNNLFHTDLNNLSVKNYKAVVDIQNKHILSVVSNEYSLVTNRLAVTWAKEIFADIFGIDLKDQLVPFKVINSARKTFCHIDLIHQEYSPIKIDQDSWLPLIRITNSYNRTYPLVFHIGFVRSICSNGVIFQSKTLTFRQTHTEIVFKSGKSLRDYFPNYYSEIAKFKTIKADFLGYMNGLYKLHIPFEKINPVVKKVLSLKFQTEHPSKIFREKAQQAEKLYNELINDLSITYSKKLENTAYCALNVMTDLITHGDIYGCIPGFSTKSPILNLRVIEWVQSFPLHFSKKDFKWENYLSN